jgi:hypothetical protein
MFTQNIWGFGVLGNCGGDFVTKLQDEISPLWKGSMIPASKPQLVPSHGRAV